MRILVLGRHGQVGTALTQSLQGLGELITLDRAQLDLSNPDAIQTALRELQPQMIINAAAYTAVDAAELDAATAFQINAEAPRVIAEESERLGAALIHYSTDYVFDGGKQGAWLEDDAPAPLSVYGHSKLAGEQAITDVGGNHLILRTSWVYGLHGKNFLLTMLRLAETRDELAIVDVITTVVEITIPNKGNKLMRTHGDNVELPHRQKCLFKTIQIKFAYLMSTINQIIFAQ